MVEENLCEKTEMRSSDNELLKDLRDKIKEINEKFDLMLRNQSEGPRIKSSILELPRRFGPAGDAFLVGVRVLRL